MKLCQSGQVNAVVKATSKSQWWNTPRWFLTHDACPAQVGGAICSTWSLRDLSGQKVLLPHIFIIHIIHLWFFFPFYYQLLALSLWSHFQTFEERISHWPRQSASFLLHPWPLSSLLFVCLWTKHILFNSLWPKEVTLNEAIVQRANLIVFWQLQVSAQDICGEAASLMLLEWVSNESPVFSFEGTFFICSQSPD